VALQLWNQLLQQRSGSNNLLRGLARCGKLRVGTATVAQFGNGSGNGEKCSWGCSGAPICSPKSPARAKHCPGDPLQPNRRFVTRLLRIWGNPTIGFVGDNFSRLDFVAIVRRKETGRWGRVRGRHERTPVRLGSGLAGRARPGAASCGRLPLLWLRFTLRGRGRAGWAALLRLGRAGVGDGCWVRLGFRPGYGPQPMLILKILFFFFQICL
jgi:hypothetical protein